jgi:ectoine hydroxylase-related dioxygenase (phytanoyl-CoA dioxygenase family)
MNKDGYIIKKNVICNEQLEKLRGALDEAEETQWSLKKMNLPDSKRDGTVHHLVYYSKEFIKLLDMKIFDNEIEKYIGTKYIVNVFNGVIKRNELENYADKIHRDIRFHSSNINLSMNMLIMLDDFTKENGATQIYPGSHVQKNKPSEYDFEKNHIELVAPAGSAVIFNSNLWHRGGLNTTRNARRAITITMTHPWLKPQIDFCKLLKIDATSDISDYVLQVLGYNHRVPENLEQWFLPEAERFYKSR